VGKQKDISLIISTYNWPKALKLVLNSVFKQSVLPNEIIIADDGSTQETETLIYSYSKQINIPILHIWHEDKGFRKSIILNKAINAAHGDYIVQIDGDTILHKHFIKDHKLNRATNTFLFGSRVSLNEKLTTKLLNSSNFRIHYFTKGLKKRNRLIRIPLYKLLLKKQNNNSKKLRGCNISYWKKDAIAINGYNESFQGWGYEDFEFVQRLINNNVYGKRLKHTAIQYHLYHHQAPKGDTQKGDLLLINTIKNKISFIDNGILKNKNEN
jgi:glycosyltransferase involved in cell wall biosynthesis